MTKYDTQTPYIASYVIIRRDDKIAFLLRSNTQWMNGYYSLPSGKVEKNESVIKAASREAGEEAGISVQPKDLKFVHVMQRHMETEWVDFYFEAEYYTGEVINGEPEVHAELAWFGLNELPENTIDSVRVALGHITSGITYSEYGWEG